MVSHCFKGNYNRNEKVQNLPMERALISLHYAYGSAEFKKTSISKFIKEQAEVHIIHAMVTKAHLPKIYASHEGVG